jgi:hypothetical protein
MNSGLITGLIAGPNRLSKAVLSRKQSIPNAEITQALANVGIARVSLSAPVTRTSTATRTNDGLSALNVNLLPSSRYRVTYRIYSEGIKGIKVALSFPSSLTRMDGEIRSFDFITFKDLAIYPDWPNNAFASEDVIYDSLAGNPSAETAIGSVVVILDIATGSTVNTYGTISLLIAQSVSNALTSTISQNSCVEVLKF